ncbi:MAG: division/cell wall cluster transcriptional repressor MraZ [Chloroherpetonaceae bacterium]|nr:division/cell wall cluster transcriptional repressor MraZ [Chloroherpetonaceae bacterium]MDW8437648.1 division/cell wall cluster transcriptional repressor MraZ [Chloroherpetonaceae bacterium]
MPNFRGTENYSIDDKGRLMIPASFRKKMTNQNPGALFVVFKTLQSSIELYEESEWAEVQKKIDALSEFNLNEKRLKTYYNANISETELDRQGRVLLPKRFLEACGIKSEVTIVGGGNKIEVWNPDKLNELLNAPIENLETLSERFIG